jgi:hypothetical protein
MFSGVVENPRRRRFVDQMLIGTGLWVPLGVLFVVRGALMLFDGA